MATYLTSWQGNYCHISKEDNPKQGAKALCGWKLPGIFYSFPLSGGNPWPICTNCAAEWAKEEKKR